jgi:hypothetical protein
MGTWGPGIFSDDVAQDVRDAWRDALMDGLDDATATKRLLNELQAAFDDENDAVVAWLALAAAQHETGRLQLLVRDRALAIIDAGGDIASWRNQSAAFVRAREKALAALAEKLRGPQPTPKTPKRPKPRASPLEIGDVVHVRGERAEGLFVVVAVAETSTGTEPVLAQLLWEGGRVPDVETLKQLPLLHEEHPITSNKVARPVQHFWQIDCPSRGKRALSNFGSIVARGVLRADAADHLRDQSRGFADGPSISGGGWDTLAAFMGYPWHRRLVETTRRIYGVQGRART